MSESSESGEVECEKSNKISDKSEESSLKESNEIRSEWSEEEKKRIRILQGLIEVRERKD
jgi:hypothetical protein